MDTENKASVEDAMVLVHLRNVFYRQKFRFMLGIFVLSIVANFILFGLVVYLIRHPTDPLYFPADKIGRLIKVVPLQQSEMTTEDVEKWAIQAVEAAYSYDFMNYRQQLQSAQKYFTDFSWRGYMKTLAASNNLKALTERKFIVEAKVAGAPKVLNNAELAGAQAWKFQMPVLVTYSMPPFNDKSKFSNPLIVTVIVQRQSVLQSYKGLAIIQLIATMAR